MPSYKEKLQHSFLAAYDKLNPAQKEAVDTIEGPVMVIAGPGTGKTQILAARIGRILLEPDTEPSNILCLTYTDAGAIAMRRRLQQFIGADAYKVNIYTFHAFCNDVIQDNLSLFEKTSLDPASELQSIQLFKDLIDEFPKNHPLKRYRGDVYFEINNLRNLFSTMKREGWTAEYITERIDRYLEDLPTRDEYVYKKKYKDFKAGDLKADKFADEKERMEKLRAAVNEFDRFQLMMYQRGLYDFDDMINWVIKAFDENPNLLADYQEKFQYILVDEYQDTSGTQNRIIQLLISYWDKPNVFVVGDDDQSIYRFQGANVENMIGFAHTYSQDLRTVVLTNNYRSTQPILDISKTLIDRNEERLVKQLPDLIKELKASHPSRMDITNQPEICAYHTVKEEMIGITQKVKKLIEDGVPAGEISVIYKENKYGEELARYFRLDGVPVYSRRSINILEHAFIRKILSIMRYVDAEHDIPYGGDELLFEIMHYDFYKIPPIDIAKLTVEMNQKKYGDNPVSLRSLLSDKANAPAQTLFDTGIHPGMKQVSHVLEDLIREMSNLTLQDFFEKLIQRGGILPYIMQHEDRLNLMNLLTALFDFIKTENSRNPLLTLHGLIEIIDLMEKENIALPMEQVTGTDRGVNLLTAHGSKGLEYEHVFFAGTNSSSWEKKRKPSGGYKFPDTMFDASAKASDEEELRRLFYVALTRAKMHLHISFARHKNDGKELEPSMFIQEIRDVHDIPEVELSIPEEEMLVYQALQFSEKAPEIEEAETDFISRLLEKFEMNVTALNNYLRCPLRFYYQNLIRIPSGKNEATTFGSAVHHALEKLFRNLSSREEDRPDPAAVSRERVIEDFVWYMRRHRENFTKAAFDRRMEQGIEVMGNYYDTYINTWNRVVAVERNIRGVVLHGVPIKGKLDKLEFTGKEVNVVDYKTGDIDKAKDKMKGPSDKDPNGGDYWRQAVFYKLLIDHYEQKDWRVVSTEFDFVEPDSKKQYRKEKIIITPADTDVVTAQVIDTWSKIQDRQFYTGCGKADCEWCNFVKDNNLAVELHELDQED